MSISDDHSGVSGNELHDIVTMAMARKTLRALVPDVPPTPSEQLAAVLRDGLPVTTAPRSRFAALTGRIAGMGLAAKVLLAAGVAAASAGGAATAVAFTHDGGHRGDVVDSPREHPAPVSQSPTPSPEDGAAVAPAPTAPQTVRPTTVSTAHEDRNGSGGGDHEGTAPDSSGSEDGTSHDTGSGDSSQTGSGDTGSGDTTGSTDSSSSDSSGSGDTSGSTSGSSDGSSDSSGSGDTSGSTSGSSDGSGG